VLSLFLFLSFCCPSSVYFIFFVNISFSLFFPSFLISCPLFWCPYLLTIFSPVTHVQTAAIGPSGQVWVQNVDGRRAVRATKRREAYLAQTQVLWTWIESIKVTESWDFNGSAADCSICIEPFQLNDTVKRLPCGHCFHATCCLPWFERKHQCPYCRYDVEEAKQQSERRAYDSDFEI
jgi:hypothetical protein